MTNQTINTSKPKLLKQVLIAFILATGLLTLVVLPTEYGIDITGFGKISGLSKISQEESMMHEDTVSPSNDVNNIAEEDNPEEPFARGTANKHSSEPSTKSFSITLQPLDEVEYKAVLDPGEPIFYRWSVTSKEDVYVDFHGDPTEGVFPEEYFQSYEEGEMAQSGGSFSPTFTGNHGWYWLNIADHEITIILEVTGYYTSLGEIFRGNQRDKYR